MSYRERGVGGGGVCKVYKKEHTSADQLKNQVELVISLKKLDHMENIWRLLTLMINFHFAEDLF